MRIPPQGVHGKKSNSRWGVNPVKIIYHRRTQKDIRSALAYYDAEGGKKLGDRFFAEVEAAARRIIQNPKGFHFAAEGLRRASLRSFPYHFLYEEDGQRVHFLVLRHDKRHPNFGLRRK